MVLCQHSMEPQVAQADLSVFHTVLNMVYSERMDIDVLNQMIGDEVRIGRARKRLSRAALADLSGLSAKTIQRIENGERPADVSQMAAICAALGESIPDLVARAIERTEQ